MRNTESLKLNDLKQLYLVDKLSAKQISKKLNCSETKVHYWISKYSLPKRSISDAVYQKLNPNGDPYTVAKINSLEDSFLLGLGLGLFWGEGNKRDKSSVRLGNSDPDLIATFLYFLENRYQIQKHRLRFGLQIFSDMDPEEVEKFWMNRLGIKLEQLYKTVVTISGKTGTYREKSKHGVLTIYFHNKKLRDLLLAKIDNLRRIDYSSLVLPEEDKPM
ncbi:MAG TPA: hypothetical protein PK609_02555 [Candidatus Paceibacterota bacterium]|nr:hypothetical protein [Candidatus Paceibacterota bacterium]